MINCKRDILLQCPSFIERIFYVYATLLGHLLCQLAILATRFLNLWQEKCSQYWPEKSGKRTWGHFTTESVSEEKVADYVVRQFSLRNQVSSSSLSSSLRSRNVLRLSNKYPRRKYLGGDARCYPVFCFVV